MSESMIVTGAGRGIGAGIAEAAAVRGWTVGLIDRDAQAVTTLAARLPNAVALPADTTNPEEIRDAFERFAATTNRPAPNALVANAGIVRFGPLIDLSLDDWRAVVEVNLTGTFICARTFAARCLEASQPGSIVTVTSMNGVAPGPNAGAYGATKSAVALLTKQMALEWGPHGIRVNAIAPGLIDAGMSEPIYADDTIRSLRSGRVPLGRLGAAADIASATLFLLSPEAAYITGTELLVDGGVTMSVIASLPRPASVDGVGQTGNPSS